VSEDLSSEPSRGARPVADAPLDALLARADELARRWAIALIVARPLAQMTDVPLEELAREAPELCAQVARALTSDAELAQLREDAPTPGLGAPAAAPASGALAALAASGDARSAVHDVEALRGVVWEVALGELPDATARQVADLSDRLAFVCATLLATLLARYAPPVVRATGPSDSPAAPGRARVLYSSPLGSPGRRRAVLIDERDDVPAARVERQDAPSVADRPTAPAFAHAPAQRQAPDAAAARSGRGHTAPRARPWDTPLDARHEPAGPRSRDGAWQQAPGGADTADPVMRITRGPGSPVERA
jgi:hypothetical protein